MCFCQCSIFWWIPNCEARVTHGTYIMRYLRSCCAHGKKMDLFKMNLNKMRCILHVCSSVGFSQWFFLFLLYFSITLVWEKITVFGEYKKYRDEDPTFFSTNPDPTGSGFSSLGVGLTARYRIGRSIDGSIQTLEDRYPFPSTKTVSIPANTKGKQSVSGDCCADPSKEKLVYEFIKFYSCNSHYLGLRILYSKN